MVLACLLGPGEDVLNMLGQERLCAIAFVIARVLHGVFYLSDKHSLRSLSWLVGMLCAVGLMVLAALRVA